MPQYIKENFIKNVIVLIIALLLWPIISNSLIQIKPEQSSDFLLIISMLLVSVCFAAFAFTYEKSKLVTLAGKLLSHFASGIYMLLTALLLETMVITVKIVYPFSYSMIFGFSVLLYIGIILYDMWDILRAE